MIRTALISTCGVYRYELRRHWGEPDSQNIMAICGANPSTADAQVDDATIRREIGFAKREGCDGLVKVNVGAFRATNPKDCPGGVETFGPANLLALLKVAKECPVVVCAWGAVADPYCVRRALEAFDRAGSILMCFGMNGDGSPKHPLYLPLNRPLVAWKLAK